MRKLLFQPFFYFPYCPNGEKDYERNRNKSEVIRFNERNQVLNDYIFEKTGNPATFEGTCHAFDVIHSMEENRFEIQDWATSALYNQMAIVYYKQFQFWTLNELFLRLRSGQFFNFHTK